LQNSTQPVVMYTCKT